MSGVDAEIRAAKSESDGKFNEAMYGAVLPGLVVSNLKRPDEAEATFRTG